LLVLFLLLGQGYVAFAREHRSGLTGAKFMLSFPTGEHIGVDSKVNRCFADTLGLRELDGGEFVFGCVGFVFGHDNLHCEAVLVVYKILAVSFRQRILFGSDYFVVRQEATEREFSIRLRGSVGEEDFFQMANTNPRQFLFSDFFDPNAH
jgi:hypothetical protein